MKPITIISRRSNLAVAQVHEFISLSGGIEYEHSTADSFGDQHKEISLLDTTIEDIFTREIDAALLSGDADIALHSAKDLPYPLPEGISLIALTDCLDPSDALVTRNGETLSNLPAGAKIGTSSPGRLAQILAVRGDLAPVSIRGTIEERIAQLHEGVIDALIVATCAMKRLGRSGEIAEILPVRTNDLQGHLAVCAKKTRADLRARFYYLDVRRTWGKVYLVGGGTGSSDTLTLAADRTLAAADVIIYDDLLDQQMLSSYSAEKIYVGKRSGAHSSVQSEINEIIYRTARSGKMTVRLKGGDPSIFGRIGEELEYLGRRLITVEILPGVTSALAAAAGAGIPLTLRSEASSVSFTTAHRADGSVPPPGTDTAVYYMGSSKLDDVSRALCGAGWNADVPVALVMNAGTMLERTVITDIARMGEQSAVSPMIIIAGGVVKKRYGQERFLFTGLEAEHSSVKVPGRITQYPLICTQEISDCAPVDLSAYDAIVFTSRTAVRIFMKRFCVGAQKVFSIGPTTASELKKYGINSQSPAQANADSFAQYLSSLHLKKVLYPSSSISDNALHELANVDRYDIYTTMSVAQPLLDLSEFAGVVFTAPSTVRAFYELYKTFPKELTYYSIGPATTRELETLTAPKENIVDVQKIQG